LSQCLVRDVEQATMNQDLGLPLVLLKPLKQENQSKKTANNRQLN